MFLPRRVLLRSDTHLRCHLKTQATAAPANPTDTIHTILYSTGIIMQARHRHFGLAGQMTGQHPLNVVLRGFIWLADAHGENH